MFKLVVGHYITISGPVSS